jgi:hypothetical protein
MKFVSIMFIAMISLSSMAAAAEKVLTSPNNQVKKEAPKPKPLPTAIMSQGDFARELVNVFGWGDGLSKEPKDRDYLQILEGRRTFKFEAEKIYTPQTDDVVVRKNELLGPFSGESWLGGITVPSPVRMKVFIPVAGDYTLSAVAKGDGQIWKIAGKEYTVNSGDSLAMTKISNINLEPGELELEMLMPPEGGLDYILFTAPDFAPIEPLEGWRFNNTLTNLTMAYVAASILGLEGKLPVDDSIKPVTVIISDMTGLPSTVSLSSIQYYGKFSGKFWVSTTSKSAEINIPFTLPQTGTYDVKLRVMGNSFTGEMDGNPLRVPGSAPLEWVSLGLQRLSQGQHIMKVKVPSFGGIDALTITPRKVSPEAYMSLTGISGAPHSSVTYAEMEKNLSMILKRFTARK